MRAGVRNSAGMFRHSFTGDPGAASCDKHNLKTQGSMRTPADNDSGHVQRTLLFPVRSHQSNGELSVARGLVSWLAKLLRIVLKILVQVEARHLGHGERPVDRTGTMQLMLFPILRRQEH